MNEHLRRLLIGGSVFGILSLLIYLFLSLPADQYNRILWMIEGTILLVIGTGLVYGIGFIIDVTIEEHRDLIRGHSK